jgi:two-component system response regulator AtoC
MSDRTDLQRPLVAVVDDDEAARDSIGQLLRLRGYRVEPFDSAEAALASSAAPEADCILTDVKMPGMDGEELLAEVRSRGLPAPVVVLTGHGDVPMAVRCLKAGAFDFLEKPFDDEVLLAYVDKAAEQCRLRRESAELRRRLSVLSGGAEGRFGMIGGSRRMQEVYALIELASRSEAPVLIVGETGVGKELVARAIHARSKRRDRPFVPVNCGSIPESLLESELFGHEKGAFTGAVASRIGLFREAEGGTLFLDEVGDLDPAFQVKLLRALQEREVRPLGGNRAYPVDVRIVSATNRDLAGMVARGSFRSDLYFRIAVIPVVIPPLRERREDILPLADNFLNKHAGRAAAAGRRLDPDARRLLLEYPWPGNIRELANAIEYAVAMSRRAVLQPADFPLLQAAQRAVPKSPVASTETGRFPQPVLDGLPPTYLKPWEVEERETILETLTRCKGNRGRAARKLRMSRTTLWRKIRRYDL